MRRSRFPPNFDVWYSYQGDQKIFFLTWIRSPLGTFGQTPTRVRCVFYEGVAFIFLTGLIVGLLQRLLRDTFMHTVKKEVSANRHLLCNGRQNKIKEEPIR